MSVLGLGAYRIAPQSLIASLTWIHLANWGSDSRRRPPLNLSKARLYSTLHHPITFSFHCPASSSHHLRSHGVSSLTLRSSSIRCQL